ncbi:MAG: hypothetical protein ABSB23_10350 [Bryobacteraceae bacterium]|jgi:hypothetical protein
MAAFRLSKWYLDCVSDSGDATILYTGAVRWGSFCLNYSSVLESAAGAVTTRRSLRAVEEPVLAGDSLHWRSGSLRIEGDWSADSAPLRAMVFSSGAGIVEWHCLMPRARARIGARQGLGYAEHLTMTIAPWRLPLRTLRWGRFLSASEWAVWIDWQGEFTRTLVYRNGREAGTVSIEDARIVFDDGTRLVLDRSLVIREGPLGLTALSGIPGIRALAAGRLLRATESKWRSRARLEREGAPPVEGWAIHETVEWPA